METLHLIKTFPLGLPSSILSSTSVALEVQSWDLQHQHHLRSCHTCRSQVPSQTHWIRTPGGESHHLCFNQPCRWFRCPSSVRTMEPSSCQGDLSIIQICIVSLLKFCVWLSITDGKIMNSLSASSSFSDTEPSLYPTCNYWTTIKV